MARFSPFPTEISDEDVDPAALARMLRDQAAPEEAEVIPAGGGSWLLGRGSQKIPTVIGKAKSAADIAAEAQIAREIGETSKAVMPKVEETTKAFHSSPHKFDKFSYDFLNEGEGSMVKGTGLYFGEAKGTQDAYKSFFENRGVPFQYGGAPVGHRNVPPPEQWEPVRDWLSGQHRPDETMEELLKRILPEMRAKEEAYRLGKSPYVEGARGQKYPEMAKTYQEGIRGLEGLDLSMWEAPKAWRYDVDIKAPKSDMLDWDKPRRLQPHITEALPPDDKKYIIDMLDARDRVMSRDARRYKRADVEETTGEDVYRMLGRQHGSEETLRPNSIFGGREASEILQKRGIPGIAFKDQVSRPLKSDWEIAPKLEEAEARLNKARTRRELDEATRDVLFWQKTIDDRAKQSITHNIVSFPGTEIDILKRYGIPGMAAPSAALLAEQLRRMDDEQYR